MNYFIEKSKIQIFTTVIRGIKWCIKRCINWGITRGIVDANMHRFFTVFLIPLIYKIVFKNASPLGFVIVLIYQKQGSRWVENLFTPSKNEISPRKNEVHI